MSEHRKERLTEFADWVRDHITGDEKGQAQIFLDRLFQAFGQKGVLEVGGTPEFRIRKAKEDGGGTSFADLVWKPQVLIEMKKRGEVLKRHYRQAFDYWTRLVPGRPRYVVLCNFDEFEIYDFENQMDEPVDRVAIDELPDRYGPLAFLFPTMERPTFGNDQEAVTRKAADKLATCFNKLLARKVERPLAQRFILQMLVALFAEDIELLDRYFVANLLDECKSPSDSYDLIGGLFVEMNSPGKTAGGRYKGVDYFNGGLFVEPARIELHADEINQLKQAAKDDWSKVRPEIFGTLFEHSLQTDERHAFGAHFTSHADIMKIVGPTIVKPWREQIESARTQKKLRELLQRMRDFRVLDPACGSGNFLYIAYRELKRLEAALFDRIDELSTKRGARQRRIGYVNASQFYGIDINPFAVELAKVTMMIARKFAIDELKIHESPLPLDNLDGNFKADDALIGELGNPAQWPPADVIIGNPPFLGAKRLKPERGAEYVNTVRKAYPDVPGMADYCVYWLRKAHDHLPKCTPKDALAGRAGLVGTQNIRNNKSREGGLDYIVQDATIVEAVDNQPWSGEANVHVSIANWVKTQEASLLPKERLLWFKVDSLPGKKKLRNRDGGPAHKEYELDKRECEFINSALSDRAPVSKAGALSCNTKPPSCFQGVVTGYSGFVVTHAERSRFIEEQSEAGRVVKPYLIGRDLLSGDGKPSRAVIDFGDADLYAAMSFPSVFEHLKENVLPDVTHTAEKTASAEMGLSRQQHLERWWQFWNVRKSMRETLEPLHRYLACSRVTKRPIFCFVDQSIVPDGALQVFALADDYSFGILQSQAHWEWFVANCSKLKSDFRYTPRSVYHTFPWPQFPTVQQIDEVAAAGRELRSVRAAALEKIKGGLRAVYRTLDTPGQNPLRDAQARLDKAVLGAFDFSERKDLLSQLLELNLDAKSRLSADKTVTSPGIPDCYPYPENIISEDRCTPPSHVALTSTEGEKK